MQRARTDTAKDIRRDQFLACAMDEFFEKGFSAARMDDIARRAGLSKGTLYLYFDSKVSLFRALIEAHAKPNLQRFADLAEAAPSVSLLLDGFALMAPQIILNTDMPKIMKVLIGDSHTFPNLVQEYRKELIGSVLKIIADALEAAKARGELRFENADLTARLLIAPVVLSGIWQALFANDPEASVDVAALFRQHVENLKTALIIKDVS